MEQRAIVTKQRSHVRPAAPALLIDFRMAGEACRDTGVGVQSGYLPLQIIGQPYVIIIQKGDQVAPGSFKCPVSGGRRPIGAVNDKHVD